MRTRLTALVLGATVALGGLAAPAAAGPGDPLPEPIRAGCPTGEAACVDTVIQEMTERFEALAATCDHDALFELTYLRTTEEYRRSVQGGLFADPAFMNHYDTVFARYYFEAYDAFHRGDKASVPPAWRLAFEAAEHQLVSGLGNLLLGMSAHVNRDLPFTLAEIGLTAPDGTSRKADHDRVNQFLARVIDPLIAEIADRLDPFIDDLDTGTGVERQAAFGVLVAWRELAWQNAQRLLAAPTPELRRVVAAQIEVTALAQSKAILAAFSYEPLDLVLGQRQARNAHCAAQSAAA